ncbi:KilA-N domain-containing protein [Aurantimonas sp. NFXS3]|uniref:KilA-N domain-containing protein n=1 Tax=Aurantimonas sp. NFXS3 TaxID=2818434 RepID=UPI003B8D6D4C
MQQHLELIPHQAQGSTIYQRPGDGYINATAMCQAAGKRWNHYSVVSSTRAFLDALAIETGIPASTLVQSIKGGDVRIQGTWVHPQVAINLAQWLSGEFAVKVSQWVYDWMAGRAKPATPSVPYHLRRYVANQRNVPVGHFSLLTEMTQALIAPLEIMGYTLPERLMPDISHGRMFCKWLRDKHGIDTDTLPTYTHVFEDGRRVQAKAYPESLLADWRRHFRDEWLPNRSIAYFSGKDSAALAYLPRLLPAPPQAA